MTQNNEREAKLKLARLRFFRDLSDDERLKIFHIFGVLPDNYDGLMNLNIQSMLFDKWQAKSQSPISQNEQQEVNVWKYFDEEYKKACESSQPKDWHQAAMYAQQVRNTLYTSPPKKILAVTSYDLASEEDETVYWLQSDIQKKGWGPFKTEIDAWKYLFGREPSEEEIAEYKNADWYVGFINAAPTNTEVGE